MKKRTLVLLAACAVVGLAVVCLLHFGVLRGGGVQPVEMEGAGQQQTALPPNEGDRAAQTPAEHPRFASWEERISRVTDEFGLTADISDCKVMLDGQPLEGKKVLIVLGDGLFVNEHPVFPPRERHIRPTTPYTYSLNNEVILVLSAFERTTGSREAALRGIIKFASSLPHVEKVETEPGGINVWYEREFIDPYCPLMTIFTGAGGFGETNWEKRVLKQREATRVPERFREVLKTLHSGATLRVETCVGYTLEG